MTSTWNHLDWHRVDHKLQRRLISFVLSVLLLSLILLIPVTLMPPTLQESVNLEIEIEKHIKPIVPETPIPNPVPIPTKKPIEKVEPKPTSKPIKPEKIQPKAKTPVIKPNTVKPKQELPSSAVILKSLYDGKPKLNPISKEFQALTQNPNDFIYQKVQAPKWNQVAKLIDEDLDKPRVQMNFYSDGIEGSFERLMDKITYKKKFTTRYGTKIYCAAVLVIGVCSWK